MGHLFDCAQQGSVPLKFLAGPRLEVAVRASDAADVGRQPAVDRVETGGDVRDLVGVRNSEQRLQDSSERAAVVLTLATFPETTSLLD